MNTGLRTNTKHDKKALATILYVGHLIPSLNRDIQDHHYEVLHFNLAFTAKIWLQKMLKIGKQLPEAIICDAELPDDHVIDFYQSFKGNALFSAIPFICISEEDSSIQKIKIFEAGIDEIYPVAVPMGEIVNRINELTTFKLNSKSKAGRTNNKKMQLLDKAIALLILIVFSPIILFIIVWLKIASNNSILKQEERLGRGYQVIKVFKFSTSANPIDSSPSKKHWHPSLLDRFLVKSKLDRLPLLINVVKGELSLFGERPIHLKEADQLKEGDWVARFLLPVGVAKNWKNWHK